MTIVNWNAGEHLVRCLESLERACEGVEAEIVVVDNASGDGSGALVRDRFPHVRLLELRENLGFAGGNNVAIRETRSDYVLVLNPDVVLAPGSVRAMVEFLETRAEAAGAGAVLVGADDRVQTVYYRRFPTRAQVLLFYTTLEIVFRRVPFLRRRILDYDLRGERPVSVDQLPGACTLLRRSVLEEVGLFDPHYFIWFEDVDWCYRARRAGHRLYALPSVRAFHAGAGSLTRWSVDRWVWQFFRSFFRFLCKHRLDELIPWSYAVVRADLVLKRSIVRIRPWIPFWRARGVRSIETLFALRKEIDGILDRHHRGELVRYTEADSQPPPFRAVGDAASSAAAGRTR